MMNELRAIWSEDQYKILGESTAPNAYFFGRQKGEEYNVYLRFTDSTKRKWIQSVRLDQDWYWCPLNRKLVSEEPKVEGFGVDRQENVLRGFSYGESPLKNTLKDLSKSVRIQEQILATGAEVTWLLPENPASWILSLHGGPESHEGLEIRYGGLYRTILQAGHAIAILNYRGSSGLSPEISRQAWGCWRKTILADFASMSRGIKKLGLQKMPGAVFGVSFGGALALALHNMHSFRKVILSSPLLDLCSQVLRGGFDFSYWFASRFSCLDHRDFSLQNICKSSAGQIHVFYSPQDEVLGGEIFRRLEREKRHERAWRFHKCAGGHAPRTYLEMKQRFGKIAEILVLA